MARTPFKMKSGNSPLFKQMGSSPVKQTDYTAMQAESTKADPRYGKMSAEDYKTEVQRQVKSKKETGSYDAMGAYDAKGKKKAVKTTPTTTTTTDTKTTTTDTPKGKETKKVSKYSTREGRKESGKKLKTKQKVAKIAATADVKTARAKYGRGSAEVKAAKAERKTLKKEQKTRRLQRKQRIALAKDKEGGVGYKREARMLAKRIAKRKAKV